jgi:hypothetical protein
MADIPSVSPNAPTAPVSGSPASGLVGASVQQTPVTVTPAQPVQLSGTVVSSNPQTQQLNILTPQGPVVVQSSTPLPPDTPVSVELYTVNAQTRATITVIKQNVAQQAREQVQTLENAIQPQLPPALQEGSTVAALQLQPRLPAISPVQIDQLAASIETLKETGLQNIQLPLPQQLLQKLLNAQDIKNFLKQLPPDQFQNIANAFAEPKQNNPGILRQLISAYLPQRADEGTGIPSALEGNALPDVLDNNLLQIMQAQLQAKITQENIHASPATAGKQAPYSPLSTLDTLISSLADSQKSSGFSALLRQFMPQGLREQAPLPQNMFQLHILKILPPETTPEQIKTFLQKFPASAQTAEIEATTSEGQPLLQTNDAHFVLTTPASVPPGSKIILQATPMAPDDVMQQGLFAMPDSTLQKSLWSALQEALHSLPPASIAAQVLKNTLPTPTPQLAPTALFFLAALRSGAIENWLGANTLQALQQTGKKGLVDSLTQDFDKLSAQSKDVLPGNWRSINIPLRYDDQISQLQFYVRQQHDRDENEKGQTGGKPATRFILNLSLSRMGALQLDGFIQKKNFDIILRTEDKLPFDMRQELMKRFALGLDQVQMQGAISFQTRQQSWMVPEVANTKAEA